MERFKQFLEKGRKINELRVTFNNIPSKNAPRFLFESVEVIEEGIYKDWGKGYSYRLDKRPNNQGGNQLHIKDRRGNQWAYRHTGDKSEPNKYTNTATNIVKDIVSDIFKIDPSNIEETSIIGLQDNALLIEVKFS